MPVGSLLASCRLGSLFGQEEHWRYRVRLGDHHTVYGGQVLAWDVCASRRLA